MEYKDFRTVVENETNQRIIDLYTRLINLEKFNVGLYERFNLVRKQNDTQKYIKVETQDHTYIIWCYSYDFTVEKRSKWNDTQIDLKGGYNYPSQVFNLLKNKKAFTYSR